MNTEQQKYIITQDTQGIFRELNPTIVSDEQFLQVTDSYFVKLQGILDQAFPDKQIIGFTEKSIDQELQNRVEPFITDGAACICLDRFLLKEIEYGEKGNQFYRFGICRTTSGKKENRQARPTFSEQFQELMTQIPDIQDRKTVIVDDGLFTGGTVNEFLALAEKNGVCLSVEKIIGFLGETQMSANEQIELINEIPDLYEWIDIRDFSPMGGKLLNRSRANRITSSVPYLYPWNDGSSASLNMSSEFFDVSTAMIQEFQTVIQTYETLTDTPLTFRQLVKAGFPLPTNAAKTIPVSINDRVVDYLDQCIEQIRIERNRNVTIYDMDGTLYQLDGENNGYSGSTLEQNVFTNALLFIQKREECTDKEARTILQQGLQNSVGVSQFLADRYGIDRNDYFNTVWDIDPQNIVTNYENTVETIKKNRTEKPEDKMVILTAAPRVWAQQVLSFLGIEDCFELIFTGDQFETKEDIFQMLAKRYNPANMISVGDQEQTDILPAQKLGMRTLQISNPEDILK